MKFIISEKIAEKFPDFIVGIVVVKNLDNKGANDQIMQMLKEEESRIRGQFQLENLSQHPLIQNWRKVYKLFGEKDDRASHEALIRRILKGDSIRHINKLVDIYNYISLKYRTPVGGEDLDKISNDIRLGFADGTEKFALLGSSGETHPDKGEVIYISGKEVLCRKWNWRESDKTKLTEDTNGGFLVIDALEPLTKENIGNATNELANLVMKYCGAEAQTFVLNKDNFEIEF